MDSRLLLVFCGVLICSSSAELIANFHMSGVTGRATIVWRSTTSGTLTISLQLLPSLGTTQLEIRSLWVDYDVQDKCSDAQLGMIKYSSSASFSGNAVVDIQGVPDEKSVEGLSLVLRGSQTVCATILSDGDYSTAIAKFRGPVLGTVYFRQSNMTAAPTRIVTDLFSHEDLSSAAWRISNSYESCAAMGMATNAGVYNVITSTVPGSCSSNAQNSCPVGDLSGKHSDVPIGSVNGEARRGFTDRNLPLTSDHNINGKLLLVYPNGMSSRPVCADIRLYTKRMAMAAFSHDGITGSIHFSQNSPFDPTETMVDLQGLNSQAKGYHVHLWPTPQQTEAGQMLCSGTYVEGHFNPYNKNPNSANYPPPAVSTNDMYEVGDLSSKYGTLENRNTINITKIDYNLQLFGSNSIVGRSLVIHKNDNAASRWVCANIEPQYAVVVAKAALRFPVIGHVMFMQEKDQPDSETSIFSQLDYNDGRSATQNHMWMVKSNQIQDDMVTYDEMKRCQSTGTVYNPMDLWKDLSDRLYAPFCNANKPYGCKIGDLSGKLGSLNIRNTGSTDTSKRQFFTDVSLPLTGSHSIIGKPLAIMNVAGTYILSCAHIEMFQDPMLVAHFNQGGVSGMVSFHQRAGFGATKTSIMNELSTSGTTQYRLKIHMLPPLEDNNSCSDLGSLFNPMSVTAPASPTTDDKYPIGDLSRHGKNTEWNSYNLPLRGLRSIQGRSLVMMDMNNKIISCAKIETHLNDTSSQHVMAVSTFTGDVNGTIHLFQTLYADGTMSDTTIIVNLGYRNGSQTPQHNWHTHKELINGDSEADSGPCNSAGPHYDPFMAMNNSNNYKVECMPSNPLRCEVGDQSSKLAPYDVGSGRKLFTDVDLPLIGQFSVQGRSIVLHVQGKQAARQACADLIPITNDALSIEITTPTSFNKREIAKKYASAIRANPEDVVVELISQAEGKTTLHVHFIGLNRSTLRSRFSTILGSRDLQDSLDPYGPVIDAASVQMLSTALILFITALHLTAYF